jgi:hypothetical protein
MVPTRESGASQTDDTHDDRTVRDEGHYVEIPDTRLFVEERGRGYPLLSCMALPVLSTIVSLATTSIRYATGIG